VSVASKVAGSNGTTRSFTRAKIVSAAARELLADDDLEQGFEALLALGYGEFVRMLRDLLQAPVDGDEFGDALPQVSSIAQAPYSRHGPFSLIVGA